MSLHPTFVEIGSLFLMKTKNDIIQGWTGANALAYFASSSRTNKEKKGFMRLSLATVGTPEQKKTRRRFFVKFSRRKNCPFRRRFRRKDFRFRSDVVGVKLFISSSLKAKPVRFQAQKKKFCLLKRANFARFSP